MNTESGKFFLGFALSWIILTSTSALASTKFERQIRFSTTLTDNNQLDNSGSNADLVTKLVPSFSLTRSRNRNSITVNGDVEMEYYQRDERTRINPKFSMLGKRHIISDLLTFDGIFYVNQSSVSSRLVGADEITNSNSLSRIYGSTLGLSAKKYFGRSVSLGARFSGSGNLAADDAKTAGGSFTTSVHYIQSLPLGGLFYGLSGSYQAGKQRSDRDDGSGDTERQTTSRFIIGVNRLSLGYVFTPTLGALLSFGESFIEDQLANTRVTDSVWDIGVSWSPNRRTTLLAGYSRRFSSGSPFVSLNYRLRRIQLSLQWSRTLAIESDDFSNSLITPFPDPAQDSTQDSGDLPEIELPGSIDPFVDSFAFAAESLSARMALRGRRSLTTFWTSYIRSENRDNQFLFDNWSIGASLFKPGTRGTSMRLTIAHKEQSNVLGEPEFAENRVGITLRKKFY